MKILNGVYPYRTYEGEIHPRRLCSSTPPTATCPPVWVMSSKKLNFLEQLTVAENVFVGRLARPGQVGLSLREKRRRAIELFERWDIGLDATQIVARPRASERQLVVIDWAVAVEPSDLVLDEPTSSLPSDESGRLFSIVRTLPRPGLRSSSLPTGCGKSLTSAMPSPCSGTE